MVDETAIACKRRAMEVVGLRAYQKRAQELHGLLRRQWTIEVMRRYASRARRKCEGERRRRRRLAMRIGGLAVTPGGTNPFKARVVFSGMETGT